MSTCNPCHTLADSQEKLDTSDPLVLDPTLYRSITSASQYLTFTCPDISFAFQHIFLYMHDPREPHLHALKRILQYIRGALDYRLQIHASCTTSLIAYFDAKWRDTQPLIDQLVVTVSTSVTILFPGRPNASLLYRALVPRQSTNASPMLLQRHIGFTTCFENFIVHQRRPPLCIVIMSAIYLYTNLVQHQRTKHIEVHIHFAQDKVATGQICVLHVPSSYQFADIFMKDFHYILFKFLIQLKSPQSLSLSNCRDVLVFVMYNPIMYHMVLEPCFIVLYKYCII